MVKIKTKTANKIIEEITDLKNKSGLDYIDTIVEYCDKNNIEIETISTVIKNSSIFPELEQAAKSKNFISK